MVKFDILNATTKAYQVLWAERHYILRLAAFPFVLKLFCYAIALKYAPDPADYLRFTLIMLPALLAEGWMLSHFVRLLMFGQRWPFRPTGNFDADIAVLTVRARGVLSGLIVFVLINMVLGLFMAIVGNYIMPYVPTDGAAQDVQIPPQIAFASFVMLGVMFWGFRLVWLYIPYAVGMDWRTYLMPLRGLSSSVQMIGLWLLCFIPVFLSLRLIGGALGTVAQQMAGEQFASFVFLIVVVLADTLKGLVVTAGMTYALFEFFQKKKD